MLALFLTISGTCLAADQPCIACHQVTISAAHVQLACRDCHGDADATQMPLALPDVRTSCLKCHEDYGGVLHGPMAQRSAEQAFVADSWGQVDSRFYEKNCAQCHVSGCLDCHGGSAHGIARPQQADCHSCHRGYYVGADYYGMAPREDSLRYQRGLNVDGQYYLKMLPDVHAEAGLSCGDCHSMQSLAAGETTAFSCRDCHEPDPQVIEHGIAAHLDKLECYACHSAWAAQEYGTFFVRLRESTVGEYFALQRAGLAEDYVRSAYLRRQNVPPLGVNERGRISPIRPQFQAFFTDIVRDKAVGEENRLLAARWKAFFPHTVRRGAVMCDACHGDPVRFLLEPEEKRIYELARDGLTLESFWTQQGQQVVNGAFVDAQRYENMSRRSPAFLRAYVDKWKELAGRGAASSKP